MSQTPRKKQKLDENQRSSGPQDQKPILKNMNQIRVTTQILSELQSVNKLVFKFEDVQKTGPAHNSTFETKLVVSIGEPSFTYTGIGDTLANSKKQAALQFFEQHLSSLKLTEQDNELITKSIDKTRQEIRASTQKKVAQQCQLGPKEPKITISLSHPIDIEAMTFRNVLDREELVEAPPDDITELHNIPSAEDLRNNEPFLRKIRMKGPYESLVQYIDIQYRLIKENFLSPFREHLRNVIASLNDSTSLVPNNNRSTRVYHGVKLDSIMQDNKAGHVLTIQMKNKLPPGRFAYGSLLVLSSDSVFSSFVIGEVNNNNKSGKHDGKIQMKVTQLDQTFSPGPKEELVLVESVDVFHVFQHVLMALANLARLDENQFPFTDQFVYSKPEPVMPDYLDGSFLDFGPMFVNTEQALIVRANCKESWPNADQLGLDASQYDAIKLAFSTKVAIIRGPPGTGKTFIGSKIIKLLMCNSSLWWLDDRFFAQYNQDDPAGRPKRPILLITNSNDALDKFLLDCVNICNLEYGVVRVGNRSRSKETERFRLDHLAHVYKTTKHDIMSRAFLIAMTTSCAAQNHAILADIKPRIIIVEEAAQMMEAHVLSALNSECQHLIMIGDEKQLGPIPNDLSLAHCYNLNVSLFERLINNNFPISQLNKQHRMRPLISRIANLFYDNTTQDAKDESCFSHVRGMKSDVLFLDHTHPEEQVGSSFANKYEANYAVALADYLACQGYKQSGITILTTYAMQASLVSKMLEDLGLLFVLVSTVDNFQGKENEIVILSLVRSNKDHQIGFLNDDKRICVAFSRARQGLYCLGNFETFRKSSTWNRILLQNASLVSKHLQLTCGKHPANDLTISSYESFEERKFGGCKEPCTFRLKCGHACALTCHNNDSQHIYYDCRKECSKTIKACGHYCGEKCGHDGVCKCSTMVEKTLDKCGHKISVKCTDTALAHDCLKPCRKSLECGHQCTKLCSEECKPCNQFITATSICKHSQAINVRCSDKFYHFQMRCRQICGEELACGHLCTSECGECFGGYIHRPCQLPCGRRLACGHICTSPCSEQCQPCQLPCERSCSHSKCSLRCFEQCTPCKEKCVLGCQHPGKQCSRLCHELCDFKPCDEKCVKIVGECYNLECVSLCGEPCPDMCPLCDYPNQSARILNVSEDEEVVPILMKPFACQHMIEKKTLDRWMEAFNQSKHVSLPTCPFDGCTAYMLKTPRYSNLIKMQENAIDAVKLRLNNSYSEASITERVKTIQTRVQSLAPVEAFKPIQEELGELNQKVTYNILVTLINKIEMVQTIENLRNKQVGLSAERKEYIEFELSKIKSAIFSTRSTTHVLSNQQVQEITQELMRVEALIILFQFLSIEASKLDEAKSNLQGLAQLVLGDRIRHYDRQNQIRARRMISILKEQLKLVTDAERYMIHQAMGFSKGHWFKCPNGHIYCITECGGAMEEAICPECQEKIGESNTLASEMDGATYAAWSDQANMNMA